MRAACTLLCLAASLAMGCGSSDGKGGGSGGTAGASEPDPQPTPVGTASGPVGTATVGPEGGAVLSADGRFEVSVPPGALAAATELTVTPLQNYAIGGVGASYRIGPEGVALQAPVLLIFHYDGQDLAGTAASTFQIAYQDASGMWRRMTSPSVDEAQRTVAISSPHFSDWSLVPGLSIRPPSATVQVGGTVELEITLCTDAAPNAGGLDSLYDCGSGLAPLLNASPQWSASAGAVMGTGASVTYQAPPQVPQQNPVAVSASLAYGQKQEILVSNVLVKDQAAGYTFTITHKSGAPQEFEATVSGTLDFESKDSDGTYYTLSGNVVFNTDVVSGSVTCHPTGTPAAVDSNGASVLFVGNDGTYTFSYSLGYSGPATCVDSATQQAVNVSDLAVALVFLPGCPGALTSFPITDGAPLQGTGQDGCVNATSSWSIQQE